MLNQKQAHLQFAQAKTQTKIAKELAMPTQTKLFKKKNPYASKKINTPIHCPTHTANNDAETQH